MNDVSFGQYYPADSFVHRCDARMKILWLIGYIVAIFIAKDFYALGACALALTVVACFSGVPIGSLLKSVKAVLFLLIFTAIINLFFGRGEKILLDLGFVVIMEEAVYATIFFAVRLFLLVLGSAVLTLTTSPVSLTDGIESLLTPLKWLHFPVHELALIMSIALRFIPILTEETARIINAQKSRGADFETGGLTKRVKAVLPIIGPLLFSAFRRADELGDAMDARCYSGGGVRTKYKKLTFTWRDLLALVLLIIVLVAVVWCKSHFPALI